MSLFQSLWQPSAMRNKLAWTFVKVAAKRESIRYAFWSMNFAEGSGLYARSSPLCQRFGLFMAAVLLSSLRGRCHQQLYGGCAASFGCAGPMRTAPLRSSP